MPKRLIVFVMLALVLLAACSSEEAPAAREEPLVSTYIMWQGFFDLDPAYAYASENTVLNQLYENLTYYNPQGSDEILRPWLATSWEANEDATEWTFHLRTTTK